MKAVLICPAERPEVPLLSMESPLACAPAMGLAVVEYWMSHLACAGVKEVVLLANDRPEQIRTMVGDGSRWGLAAEVKAEPQELSPESAVEKYGAAASVMDHFPGLPDHPLFQNYERWYEALVTWMPRAMTPDRVGVRESQPGIWMGLHGQVSREAHLCAPCWLGDHVYVGPGAVVGPGSVLENGAFIEPTAEIKGSVIGPATFVGQYVQITHSLALGNTLVNWHTGLESKVTDTFLLCSLRPQRQGARAVRWLDRMAEWLARWRENQTLGPQPILLKK